MSEEPTVSPVIYPEFRLEVTDGGGRDLDAIGKVEMTVSVVTGATRMTLADVQRLDVGTIVELDRSPDATVDIFVNRVRAGTGDVIVLDDAFAARVSELHTPDDAA